MTILNDTAIKLLAERGMITPFVPELIRRIEHGETLDGASQRPIPAISYGASSYGYDLRLSPKEFLVFRHVPGTVVNPKAFSKTNLQPVELQEDKWGKFFILPHHSYGLGVALEHLKLPQNITALFIGKSTYARCGVIANLTPGEAGWHGHLTLEFSNSSSADVRIYANEGIVQALFFSGEPCGTSYEDRSGKYQGQTEGVTLARA